MQKGGRKHAEGTGSIGEIGMIEMFVGSIGPERKPFIRGRG